MTSPKSDGAIAHRWYTRPVFFVTDIHQAARFYTEKLGFEKAWHTGDGAGTVCQVNHGECEIILSQDSARSDRSRLFIELTPEAILDLRHEIEERSTPFRDAWWGYDVIQIDDPDGNELLFPISDVEGS